MHQAISNGVKPIVLIIGVLFVWWALDYLIARPVPNIDVSRQNRYASVLGKRFITLRDLVAIGYTVDRNYKKQNDYITLIHPPGFSGPEVVAKGQLPKGSVLEVTAVLKADSWLVNRIEYVVKRIDGDQPLSGRMVLDVDLKSGRNYGLSETEFKAIDGNS